MADQSNKDTIRGFILTPRKGKHGDVMHAVETALHLEGVVTDHFLTEGDLYGNGIRGIESADFVIADVTQQSPHVMYELGFAHALRKPTVLLADGGKVGRVDFDLGGSRFIIYDTKDLSGLTDDVRRLARRFVKVS